MKTMSPASIRHAEAKVAAGSLLYGRSFGVKAEDFEDDGLRVVFAAGLLSPRLDPEDPQQVERLAEVARRFEVDGKKVEDAMAEAVDMAGGSAFMKENLVERDAAVVRSEARKRKAKEKVVEIGLGFRPDDDDSPVLEYADALRELDAARKGDLKVEIPSLRIAMKEAIEEAKGPPKGPYGLLPKEADATYRVAEAMDGWNGLIMVPAAPGVGKTTFTLQAGVEVAGAAADAVVVFFSFEMSFARMRDRLLSHLSGVSVEAIRRAGLKDAGGFDSAERRLEKIADRFAIVSADMVGRIGGPDARQAFRPLFDIVESQKRKAGVDRAFVVVDNMQQLTPLLSLPPGLGRDAMEVDRYAMEGFKALRDDLGDRDPVVVISETRKGDFDKPDLGSALGTGRIVYAADHVLVMASPPWPGQEDDEDDDEDSGRKSKKKRKKIDSAFTDAIPEADRASCSAVEITGSKVRDGRRGTHRLVFDHQRTRFVVVGKGRP